MPPTSTLLLFTTVAGAPLREFAPSCYTTRGSLRRRAEFSLLSTRGGGVILSAVGALIGDLVSGRGAHAFCPGD